MDRGQGGRRGLNRRVAAAIALMFSLGCGGSAAAAADQAAPAAALDLLIQKVCTDPDGTVLPLDPFACRSPDRLRPLRVGEALPYHKHDQPQPGHPERFQRKDSYPVLDLEGRLLVVTPFDHEPFDHFQPFDGYGLYRVRDGWASSEGTRDGGGFSTTFFGAGCRPGGGWVFFPLAASIVAGSADLPLEGRHWQQNGEAWPGRCDPRKLHRSATSWQWLPAFPFGGVGGAPLKKLDALRSIHGNPERPAFLARGHLEIFYFTKLYGLTRWETWRPQQQLGQGENRRRQAEHARKVCGGPYEMNYRRVALVMTGCRDWSAVTVSDTPEPPPAWPIPDLNLLRNFSFADGTTAWTVAAAGGEAPEAGALRLASSRLPRDIRYLQPGGTGLRYLAVGCTAGCVSLTQTVPRPPGSAVSHLDFAATVRPERVLGTVRLELQQLDAADNRLAESTVVAQVSPGNNRFNGSESVLLSSTFVVNRRPVPVDPRARMFRLTISPASPGIFDITDAWLMPSPARR